MVKSDILISLDAEVPPSPRRPAFKAQAILPDEKPGKWGRKNSLLSSILNIYKETIMSDTFSERFTNSVNLGGQFTVQVNGRRRMPSSGIVYKSNLIVTANHSVEREDDVTVTL